MKNTAYWGGEAEGHTESTQSAGFNAETDAESVNVHIPYAEQKSSSMWTIYIYNYRACTKMQSMQMAGRKYGNTVVCPNLIQKIGNDGSSYTYQ